MSAVVFIHGAGCTAAVFAAQLCAFDNAIALELPGHGLPGEPDSIAAFADAVAAELESRELRDVVLCGHSMGGAVALELALRQEPRVAAIALLSSGARLRVGPAIFDALERDFDAAAREIAGYFFADPTAERLETATAMMLAVGQAQTLRDFRACNAFDRIDRLGEIDVPLFALCGDRDVMTPPKFSLALADRVPGARARIIAGAGHLAIVERPEETNAALRAFVDQIAPPHS
jgi:pimeloyl-ACP methyl ester carboxylesterase